jgi:hypothetical protein
MADTTVRSNRVRQQHHETVEVATSRTRAHLTSSPRLSGSRREHGAGSSSPANADALQVRN